MSCSPCCPELSCSQLWELQISLPSLYLVIHRELHLAGGAVPSSSLCPLHTYSLFPFSTATLLWLVPLWTSPEQQLITISGSVQAAQPRQIRSPLSAISSITSLAEVLALCVLPIDMLFTGLWKSWGKAHTGIVPHPVELWGLLTLSSRCLLLML